MPPKQPPALMHRQEDRLASFQPIAKPKARARHGWPHTPDTHPLLTPANMAHAGFYFSPGGSEASFDTCVCFLCGVRLGGWAKDDDPWHEHATRGDCAWAETVCRVELDNRANRAPVYTDADMLPSSSTSSWIRENTYYSKERQSCWWPHVDEEDFIPQPKTLAAAGFVYTPTPDSADLVMCPHCTYAVEGWEPEDDPLEIHRRKRPGCAFFTAEVTSNSKGKRGAKSKKKVEDEPEPESVPAPTAKIGGGHSRNNSRSTTTTAAAGPRTRQQTSEAPSEVPAPATTRATRAKRGPAPKTDLVEVEEDHEVIVVGDTTEAEETETEAKSKSKSKSQSKSKPASRSTKASASSKATKGKGKKTDDEADTQVEKQEQELQEEPEEVLLPAKAKKGSKTSSRKTFKAAAAVEPEPEVESAPPALEEEAEPQAAPKSKPARGPRATKAKKKPEPEAEIEAEAETEATKPLPPLPPPSPAPAPLSQLERFANIPPSSPVSLPAPAPRPTKAIPTKTGKANSRPAPRLPKAQQAAPLECGARAARQVVDSALDSLPPSSSTTIATSLPDEMEMDMTLEQWIRAEMVRKRAEIEREGEEMIRAFERRTTEARRRIEGIPTR